MTLKHVLTVFLLLPGVFLAAQPGRYTAGNAHSHNDYEQKEPFSLAYAQRFGSLEADLFLRNDSLFVAHEPGDIKSHRTFKALYLTPILQKADKNGRVYKRRKDELQLLIDLKTEGRSTLAALVKELEPMASVFYPQGRVKVVLSGNVPPQNEFSRYPAYIYFDGRPDTVYTPEALEKVALISQSFGRYSRWKGEGPLPEQDRELLKQTVDAIHQKGKKVRFWATPDTETAWKALMDLRVDYLNTDRIEALAAFLSAGTKRK